MSGCIVGFIVNLSIYNNPQMCYTKEKTGGEKYGSNRRIA